MKKKFFGGIAVLALVAIAAFNMNLKVDNGEISTLSMTNVIALAGENDNVKKCNQNHKDFDSKEMCSTYPVKHRTQIGVNFSLKQDANGFFAEGKQGFEGTITNECVVWPSSTTTHVTAPTVKCK